MSWDAAPEYEVYCDSQLLPTIGHRETGSIKARASQLLQDLESVKEGRAYAPLLDENGNLPEDLASEMDIAESWTIRDMKAMISENPNDEYSKVMAKRLDERDKESKGETHDTAAQASQAPSSSSKDPSKQSADDPYNTSAGTEGGAWLFR